MIYRIFPFLVIFLILLSSCSTKKNIIYLQNLDESYDYSINYGEYKIQLDDILKIDVSSSNEELSAIFNQNFNYVANTKESLLYSGYLVDSNGMINFPSVGMIEVSGLTLVELRDLLYENITELELLKDPKIDIKLLNSSFTILGEVNRPGRYDFIRNNLNILDAIGMAGDLKITGQRNGIRLLRELDNKLEVINIDLTKSELINNPGFQIVSGDIIIVNPNTTTIKNAGIIGNSGTLLSLLSFILSSIIVISNSTN